LEFASIILLNICDSVLKFHEMAGINVNKFKALFSEIGNSEIVSNILEVNSSRSFLLELIQLILMQLLQILGKI